MSKKNAIVKKTDEKYLVTVVPPSEEMDLGKKINYFQDVIKQSFAISGMAAVINGVLLSKAKIEHPQTFLSWLEANTSVSERTCYNYIAVATKTLGNPLVEELAKKGTNEIQSGVQVAMAKLKIESKPLSELYCEVGIMKKTPSKMGGKREGAGRKRKDSQEELAKQAEAISASCCAQAFQDTLGTLYRLAITEDAFGTLVDVQIKTQLDILEKIVARGKEILKSRKGK